MLPVACGVGIYFVPALLNDPDKRREQRNRVDWAHVDAMLDFGGIRIGGNVLTTPDGHDVISADVPVLV